MLFATVGQGAIFLFMMGAGVLMGFWYALTALLRGILQAGRVLTILVDLLFGLGCAVLLVAALVYANYGRLRLYELLAVLLGIGLFFLGLMPPLRALSRGIVRAARKIKAALSKNRLINVIFK